MYQKQKINSALRIIQSRQRIYIVYHSDSEGATRTVGNILQFNQAFQYEQPEINSTQKVSDKITSSSCKSSKDIEKLSPHGQGNIYIWVTCDTIHGSKRRYYILSRHMRKEGRVEGWRDSWWSLAKMHSQSDLVVCHVFNFHFFIYARHP